MNRGYSQNISFVKVNVNLVVGNVNSRQKWKNDKCQCESRKTIKFLTSDEDYAWNPSTFASEFHIYYEIGKYLKDCECMKSLADDMVVTCDEIEDTQKTAVINPSYGIDYRLIVGEKGRRKRYQRSRILLFRRHVQ